jgi:hypothetical protein
MSKLLPLVVVLTVIPGFLWWIVIAAMMPGIVMLLEDLEEWWDRPRGRVLIPVRVERVDWRRFEIRR